MRGTLGTGELLDIARVLESVKNAVSYGVRTEDDLEADSLDELFESLVPLDDLLHEIRRCIISEEEISDDASSTFKTYPSCNETNKPEDSYTVNYAGKLCIQSG